MKSRPLFGNRDSLSAYPPWPSPLQAALEDLPKQDHPNQDYLMAAFKAHGERLNARQWRWC